ncbi:MAG: hypothetical protein IJT27_00465 [Clostridia bacterium]|nr:hypothetical protein [Clostridia bacterium]
METTDFYKGQEIQKTIDGTKLHPATVTLVRRKWANAGALLASFGLGAVFFFVGERFSRWFHILTALLWLIGITVLCVVLDALRENRRVNKKRAEGQDALRRFYEQLKTGGCAFPEAAFIERCREANALVPDDEASFSRAVQIAEALCRETGYPMEYCESYFSPEKVRSVLTDQKAD